jgi:hypothetical protein
MRQPFFDNQPESEPVTDLRQKSCDIDFSLSLALMLKLMLLDI